MLKDYLKSEYNLRGIKDASSSNYDSIILEKKYGRIINICEWIDNLCIDCNLDGGIDYIVIDINGEIIPLIEENDLFDKMEELIFDELDCKDDNKTSCDLTPDSQIKYILEKIDRRKQKIKPNNIIIKTPASRS